MTAFQKFDAGATSRTPAVKGRDCQVRALVSALGVDYQAAWKLLYQVQGERGACGFQLVESLRDKDARFNVVRSFDFPAVKGKPRMTAETFAAKHPRGRFILRMAHHVACVKDGKILDTHDCSDRCVYAAWEIEPKEKHE